uniref:Uncharacterized protein AlNc14C86G5496 n=1 Tax=Albugo laibachii Nc14 TaxID=890382 RepID=F0WFW1_9STRA|nr:conserved hypothetical protein [Albugo laibachii Nc14]|eukprot:CCA20095.1 conserved hypothetical protein [Albugo laibachii Nc14]
MINGSEAIDHVECRSHYANYSDPIGTKARWQESPTVSTCYRAFIHANSSGLTEKSAVFATPNRLKRLPCSFTQACEMTFSRKDHLTRHITRYHTPKIDGTTFSCRYCAPTRGFQTRFEIEQHYQTHHPNHNDISHACTFPNCQKTYSKKEHLKRHQRACGHMNVEKEECRSNIHSCDLCQATFLYKHGLDRHLLRSHAVNALKSHQCGTCLLAFRKKHMLQAHMFIHTGVVPFPCAHCDQAYMKRYQLVKHHKAKHSDKTIESEKSKICVQSDDITPWNGSDSPKSESVSICESDSESESEIDNASSSARIGARRESGHLTKSSIHCQLCDRYFRFRKNFRAHLPTHFIALEHRKQYQCPYVPCEKRYTTKSNLKTHIQALHDPTRNQHYTCPVEACAGVFAYRHTLQQHLERIHAREQELMEYTTRGYCPAEDAARGYDELVDLYCDDDAPRNFGLTDAKALPAAEWSLPSGERHADLIPVIPNTYFTIDEVIQAVTREKGIDVRTLDLEGKSSLAKYMVFVTCRSQSHMRRLADMMIRSLKARNLNDDFEYAVEGRNCDDWMIADCNTIVIHFLREDTRRILKLEEHWELMENDRHKIYGHMSPDEYMDRFGTSELMDDATSLTDEPVAWK